MQLEHGFHEEKGNYRPTMEDAHFINSFEGRDVTAVGVFDGHGGREAADFVAQNLPSFLQRSNSFHTGEYGQALIDSFQAVDKALHDHMVKRKIPMKSGATAVCALFDQRNNKIIVANAGDARAVLLIRNKDDNSIVELSRDHKAGKPYEQERLLKAANSKTALVSTTPSRGFGDFTLKLPLVQQEKTYLKITENLVTPIPEIQTYELKTVHDSAILIVACDGVWDKMTSEEAANFCSVKRYVENRNAQQCAEDLAQRAIDKLTKDNVSVIVSYVN